MSAEKARSRAWLDGSEVTAPEAREALRREVVRADRVVIIMTDGVREPRSVVLGGPIAREVFGMDASLNTGLDPSFDPALGVCALDCNLGWEGPGCCVHYSGGGR